MKKLMIVLPLVALLVGCDKPAPSAEAPEAAPQAAMAATDAAVAVDAAATNPHAMPSTDMMAAAPAGHPAPMPDAAAGYQHPTPAATADMLIPQGKARPVALNNEGTVLQNIKAAGYSYLEVQQNGQSRWLAVTQMEAAPGDVVRYEDGMEMKNFHSKTLQRTFPSVLFVGHVEVSAKK